MLACRIVILSVEDEHRRSALRRRIHLSRQSMAFLRSRINGAVHDSAVGLRELKPGVT